MTMTHDDLLKRVCGLDNATLIKQATEASIAFKNNEIPDDPNWIGIGMLMAELVSRLSAMEQAKASNDDRNQHLAGAMKHLGITHYGETGQTIRHMLTQCPVEQVMSGVVAGLQSRLAKCEKVVEAANKLTDESPGCTCPCCMGNYANMEALSDALKVLDKEASDGSK